MIRGSSQHLRVAARKGSGRRTCMTACRDLMQQPRGDVDAQASSEDCATWLGSYTIAWSERPLKRDVFHQVLTEVGHEHPVFIPGMLPCELPEAEGIIKVGVWRCYVLWWVRHHSVVFPRRRMESRTSLRQASVRRIT